MIVVLMVTPVALSTDPAAEATVAEVHWRYNVDLDEVVSGKFVSEGCTFPIPADKVEAFLAAAGHDINELLCEAMELAEDERAAS